jgi:hypothetical protein
MSTARGTAVELKVACELCGMVNGIEFEFHKGSISVSFREYPNEIPSIFTIPDNQLGNPKAKTWIDECWRD